LAITNPFSGVWEMIYRQNGGDGIYFFFASLAVGAAAGGTFIVNLPFFVLQMLRFHPPARPAVLEKAA
jgi:Ni/Fe-hydrogenase subunit HybB-like protein